MVSQMQSNPTHGASEPRRVTWCRAIVLKTHLRWQDHVRRQIDKEVD